MSSLRYQCELSNEGVIIYLVNHASAQSVTPHLPNRIRVQEVQGGTAIGIQPTYQTQFLLPQGDYRRLTQALELANLDWGSQYKLSNTGQGLTTITSVKIPADAQTLMDQVFKVKPAMWSYVLSSEIHGLSVDTAVSILAALMLVCLSALTSTAEEGKEQIALPGFWQWRMGSPESLKAFKQLAVAVLEVSDPFRFCEPINLFGTDLLEAVKSRSKQAS